MAPPITGCPSTYASCHIPFHEKFIYVKIKNSFLLIFLGGIEQRNPASIRSLQMGYLNPAARLIPLSS